MFWLIFQVTRGLKVFGHINRGRRLFRARI
jgi:hypothetical protein